LNSNAIETLKPILEKEGVVEAGLEWNELSGGRSNFIWRVGDKVCKLYQSNRSSDLFPNNPNTEQKILKFLEGSFIAPEFIYFNKLSIGFILVYQFVDGLVCNQPSEELAKTLSRLHAV
jgi:predicted Ser/Thr protein kinase